MIRLRIDNNFIELEEKTDLSFIFENQLFSSDIKLSRTIEFNIPATSNNKKFLNFANRPDFDGNKIRYKYIAELWYSGGKINGELLISEFSDNNFKAIFIYGNLLKFKEIKEKGEISTYLNLPDKITSPYYSLAFNYLDNVNNPVPFAFFNYLNGVPDNEKLDGVINLMPTVNFNYLLQSCADFFSANLNFPENYDILSKKIGIVLSTMKEGKFPFRVFGNLYNSLNYTGENFENYFEFSTNNFVFYAFTIDGIPITKNVNLNCIKAKKSLTLSFDEDLNYTIQFANDYLYNFGTFSNPRFNIKKGDIIFIEKNKYFTFITTNENYFSPIIYVNDKYLNQYYNFFANWSGDIDCSFSYGEDGNMNFGDDFYLTTNLPKLTFLDLLNIFANLTYSSFIWNEDTQTIEFFNYEFDKSNFIDLTERLISINNVKRYLPNFAQNNYIRCNSDKYVKEFNKFKINYQVFNENLETEKDYYVIPLNEGNKNEKDEVLITDFEEDKLVAEKGTLIYYNDCSNLLVDGGNYDITVIRSNNRSSYPIIKSNLQEGNRKFVRIKRDNVTLNPTIFSIYNTIPLPYLSENVLGKEITIAFDVRASANTTSTLNVLEYDPDKQLPDYHKTINLTTDWQRIYTTFIVSNDLEGGFRFCPHFVTIQGDINDFYVDISNYSVIFGNVRLGWTPNPFDVPGRKYHFHINKFKEENDTFIQKNFLDIINNSTTIEVKVQMYLHEFLKINEKTLYKINTILYNVISATFSNNICTLTLVKI